jgi:hypothetical protein
VYEEEKNMLKTGEKIPHRRQGGLGEKKAGRREGPLREAQAFRGVIAEKEARIRREEPEMPATPSKIVSSITDRAGHDFSAYKKSAVIRGIQRRMRADRVLSRQK